MNFMHQAVVVLVYTWNYSESVLQPLLQYTEQTISIPTVLEHHGVALIKEKFQNVSFPIISLSKH